MQDFYTIDDVRTGALPPGAKLGVVGNPIAHSLSPHMQQAALDADRRGITYIRLLCERTPGAFAELMHALRRAGFRGVNVTVPFKRDAYELADERDSLSESCGAANTLFFGEDKTLCWNTDGPGFARAIYELSHLPLSEHKIVLLGACGGAGSALAVQCAQAGCLQLTLVNRPRPELEQLEVSLKTYEKKENGILALRFDEERLATRLRDATLIVNATSVGLRASDDLLPIPADILDKKQYVYDIITHETPLVREAQKRGCTAANGRRMLLWQGVYAYENWFGDETFTSARQESLAEKMYAAMLSAANA